MLLRDKINGDIATAMKARETTRLSALRMLKAAVMNKGIEKSHDLDDSEVLQVVSALVNQRRDSIEHRPDLGRGRGIAVVGGSATRRRRLRGSVGREGGAWGDRRGLRLGG